MTSCTIGIDPGLSGALAVLGSDRGLELIVDLPIVRDRSLAWVDGGELQAILIDATRGRPACALVERVGSMPKQGIASAFKFGCGLGSVLSVLQAVRVSIEFTTPAAWKAALHLGTDKRASIDRARLLYPYADLTLAKHDGRAEALLIAHYALTRRTA